MSASSSISKEHGACVTAKGEGPVASAAERAAQTAATGDVLLLDCGNSRLKVSLLHANALLEQPLLPDPESAYAACCKVLRGYATARPVQRVLVSSVRSMAFKNSLTGCLAACGLPDPEWATTCAGAALLASDYALDQLGVDRYLALLAARARQRSRPMLVVDCGTAVTLDRLEADGRHSGGVIAPGLEMMRAALGRATAALPDITADGLSEDESGDASQSLPQDTTRAIIEGTRAAFSGLISAGIARLDVEDCAEILISGGDARVALSTLGGAPRAPTVLSTLIFEGLLLWAGIAFDGERTGCGASVDAEDRW